jgi:hypothetical protein
MPWWLLLVLLIVVWFLEAVAAAAAKTVAAKRRGILRGSGGGVSVMPGLIFFPVLFLGIALAVDHVANPWGTRTIGLLHAVFGIVLVTYIAWAFRYLKGSQPGDAGP